ncbi:SIR2 family protein [Mesorhizobium marinum]|uniref:SIR2 family protein n=1 Tax=Mesorhizobium marinum TaxID=3228790 RepID=A0ABV3R4D1_9HYPH
MARPIEELQSILQKHPAAPFLFIGSGFSRRYLGLSDWAGLLQRFCEPIRDFGYYISKANGDLPKAASNMAQDYNEWWWSAPDMADSRSQFAGLIKGSADALKVEIAKYLSQYSLEDARNSEFGGEIAALSKIAVDGVITTNWDFFLEELFPDYKVFIGQEELLFSNPQSIGEIYKIHGSASDPRSLILTAEDYAEFNARNPYLAAKLVTIFVEHPIIFFGYSITDPHIRALISSIARCLPQHKIDTFQQNLIFIQRTDGDEQPVIEKTTIQSGEFSVTMMVAKFTDFGEIYAALSESKRKMPARVLRFFKEQLYELVHAPVDSEKKIAVVDYDEIGSAESVEFVVGVGVAQRQQDLGKKVDKAAESALAKKGYAGVSPDEVFVDCLQTKSKFDASDLLGSAFPAYARSNRTFIPVFRYLHAAKIRSEKELAASSYEGAKKVVEKLRKADYTLPSYGKRFKSSFAGLSTKAIIEKATDPIEALLMVPFQPPREIDPHELRQFLHANSGNFKQDPYRTAYRKAVCLVDRLIYGFRS